LSSPKYYLPAKGSDAVEKNSNLFPLTLNILYCLFPIRRINKADSLRYEKIFLSSYHFILQRIAVELRAC